MIIEEFLNEGKLVKHYSDKNVMLLQNETGVKYSDPIDVVPCRYTYTETDEVIEEHSQNFSDKEFRKMIEEAL
jgi:hypothetical protein